MCVQIEKDKLSFMIFKNRNSRCAFTLAEVLIVLLIIGVIAAFLIPLLITNSSKTQLVSQLQKAANTFTNMINSAQTSVKMEAWNYDTTTEDFVKTYVLPYVNVAKDCGLAESGCFAEEYTTGYTSAAIDNNYYKVVLADGIAMAIKLTPGCSETNPSECVDFIVDVNSSKTPNKWGKDVFNFQILHNLNAVVPYGTFDRYNSETSKWEFSDENDASEKCLNTDERYCALKIINDGWEMNY